MIDLEAVSSAAVGVRITGTGHGAVCIRDENGSGSELVGAPTFTS